MSIEEIITMLRASDLNQQERGLNALLEIGKESVEPLIALLERHDDIVLRRGIAVVLTGIQDERVVPTLITVLEHDQDTEVRCLAAQALAFQGDARAVEPLIGALGDLDAPVVEAAARALGALAESLESPRIVAALTETLDNSDWGARQSAAEMLIRLDADAADGGERLLLAHLESETAEIRLGAARSLVELGDGRALEPLASLLEHENIYIAVSAAYGLAKMRDQRAVKALTAALNHAERWVRVAAKAGLRHLESLP